MLNSTEHAIYPAINVKIPTSVGIPKFVQCSRINERVLMQEKLLFFGIMIFYEILHAHEKQAS